MNIKNYYYKEYFKNLNFSFLINENNASDNTIDKIKERNHRLCSCSLTSKISHVPYAKNNFRMKIDYPGLVTGVGIGHEANIKEEFKLGMHFDSTTGMPVIFGSSIKGVLRSYLMDCLMDKYEEEFCEKMIEDIFEGKKSDGTIKSIYDRDIFFDAVIEKGDKYGHILASDSITPHKQGTLKDPIPITFMKIAPGCELEFRFHLVDSNINGMKISAIQKLAWFKDILGTYGIGAKTNVGYGQLTAVN